MPEIHKADPGARRKTIMLLAVIVPIGLIALGLLMRFSPGIVNGLQDWILGDPARTLVRVKLVVAGGLVIFVTPLLAVGWYFWRLGSRVIRTERHPPPESKLVRDAVIRRGAAAVRVGWFFRVVGVLLLLLLIGIVRITWSLASRMDALQAACFDQVGVRYADAQRAWQNTLQDVVIESRPEYAEAARVAVGLQLSLIDRKEARLAHLLRAHPERVPRHEGLAAFVDAAAEWSDEDEAALRSESSSAEALSARVDSLRALNDAYSDWPALREAMRGELTQTDEYRAALDSLVARQTELEEMLAGCALENLRERIEDQAPQQPAGRGRRESGGAA
jgi:hypothetical protein